MNWRILTLISFCLGLLLVASPRPALADVSISDVATGTEVTANNEIESPTSKFTTDTAEIFCTYSFEGGEGAKVKAALIAVDVGGKAPPNFKIKETEVDLQKDSGTGKFSFSKPNKGWPAGEYKIEIYVNDKLSETTRFTVN